MDIINKIDLNDRPLKMGVLALAALGALQLLKMTLRMHSAIFRYILLPRYNFADRYGKGSWAVVTGAADGIGKQYALAFAKEGFNIVLMDF